MKPTYFGAFRRIGAARHSFDRLARASLRCHSRQMALFPVVRPLLFALPPERAHAFTLAALTVMPARARATDPMLASRVAGIDFPNPVGLAAGVDKDARVPDAFVALGFGFAEVGTLTPLAQKGNPRPRLFRLPQDRAVINRLGFNNGGQPRARARLLRRAGRTGIVGVNLGANRDAVDRVADYAAGVTAMRDVADYLTINVSSPNTAGLRALQTGDALAALLRAVRAARGADGPPLFLKVAPDLDDGEVAAIAAAAMAHGIDALIVSNTTIARPPLRSAAAAEAGGLSGAPLRAPALDRLRAFRRATGGAIPLIGVGGIGSGADAYARIRAGASLVQLYTALIYEGPLLARRIAAELVMLLRRDGFASVADAVGTE